MQTVIAVLVGLVLSAPVVAEPLVEGHGCASLRANRLRPPKCLVFDWTNLQRGAVAQATTDATGYFALPLASLGGSALPQAWTLGQNYPNPFNPSTDHSLSCADGVSGALRGVQCAGGSGLPR